MQFPNIMMSGRNIILPFKFQEGKINKPDPRGINLDSTTKFKFDFYNIDVSTYKLDDPRRKYCLY
jgi:hypothetical protein